LAATRGRHRKLLAVRRRPVSKGRRDSLKKKNVTAVDPGNGKTLRAERRSPSEGRRREENR